MRLALGARLLGDVIFGVDARQPAIATGAALVLLAVAAAATLTGGFRPCRTPR